MMRMTGKAVWTPAPYGLPENPGVFDTGNGALRTIERCADFPGVERVTVKSYCGRTDDDCVYYRLETAAGTTFDTLAGAIEAARLGMIEADAEGALQRLVAMVDAGASPDYRALQETAVMRAARAAARKGESAGLRAENRKLRAVLDDAGFVSCPVCGGYDTGAVPDANGDPAADYCKTCGHGW